MKLPVFKPSRPGFLPVIPEAAIHEHLLDLADGYAAPALTRQSTSPGRIQEPDANTANGGKALPPNGGNDEGNKP